MKVCCDLLLKLHPCWNPSTRRADVGNAIVAMQRVIELLACEESDEPNSNRMLEDLRKLDAKLAR